MLWQLVYNENKTYIVQALKYYVENDELVKFEYNGNEYWFHKLPENFPNDMIQLFDSDITITINELIKIEKDITDMYSTLCDRNENSFGTKHIIY